MLVNRQVAQLSKETGELIAESSDFKTDKKPSFIEALGYEDFLDDHHPAHAGLRVPPAYVHKERHERGAVIMHSSGTTGLPKPISHAPSYLIVYAACHRIPEQNEPFAYNVSTLPLYHVSSNRNTYSLDSKPLTTALASGFWSPCSLFGALDRHALHIAPGVHNSNCTLNSLRAHLYQSPFHDVGSLNPRGHVNHEGIKRTSCSSNAGFHCYWWCTHERTYRSRARGERRKTTQSLGLVIVCTTLALV